jgi:hypothetical protein
MNFLTGRLPFELGADDQTNWAHYHIASAPLAPDAIRPDVPGMLDHHPQAAGKAPR